MAYHYNPEIGETVYIYRNYTRNFIPEYWFEANMPNLMFRYAYGRKPPKSQKDVPFEVLAKGLYYDEETEADVMLYAVTPFSNEQNLPIYIISEYGMRDPYLDSQKIFWYNKRKV